MSAARAVFDKERIREGELVAHFPHKKMREGQAQAFAAIASAGGTCVLELPTGTGKTAVGYTFLMAMRDRMQRGTLFYLVPTKTLVDQVAAMYPGIFPLYGRNEFRCRLYPDRRADEVPCYYLAHVCPHKNRDCAYYEAKRRAVAHRGVVVTTFPFFFYQLMAQELWKKKGRKVRPSFEEPFAVVVDEAHSLARLLRLCFSSTISERHLRQLVSFTASFSEELHALLSDFYDTVLRIVRVKPSGEIFNDYEIGFLLDILQRVDEEAFDDIIIGAVKSGAIDITDEGGVAQLNRILKLRQNLIGYTRRLVYATGEYPANYVFGHYEPDTEEDEKGGRKSRFKLHINTYIIRWMVERYLLKWKPLVYSATIGNPTAFGWETGIQGAPFTAIGSEFPHENTRLYLPEDTPNLAVKARRPGDVARAMRMIAGAAAELLSVGVRSLVIVVSEKERERFAELFGSRFSILTADGDLKPREAMLRFRNGEGELLLGTAAQYAEGIDLPFPVSPATFFLRPGYPRPDDPQTQFEKKRFGKNRWAIWNWRVTVQALQARGRNVRSRRDVGVTFFISQQFNRVLGNSLPEWLRPAVRRYSMRACIEDAVDLLTRGGR